eukprot:508797_1
MYNWYINNIIKWYKLMRWSINNIWSNMMIINGTFLGATWSANIKSLIGSDGYLNELPPESLSTSSCPWSAVRIHLNHQHVTFKSISNIIIRIIIWYNSINWSISSNTWCQWYISRIIIGWISKCIINKMIKWISKCIIKCTYYFTATLTSTVSNLWFTTTLISTVSNLRICLSSTGPASKSSQHQLSSASVNIAACETNLAGGFNYNFISRIFSIWIIIMCIISTSSSSTTTFSTTSISIFTITTPIIILQPLSSHSPRPRPLPQYHQNHHYSLSISININTVNTIITQTHDNPIGFM